MTDKYLHVGYHPTVEAFFEAIGQKTVVAVDNVPGSIPLQQASLPSDVVLIFGAESIGIRPELLDRADLIAAIEQFGSTRSLNVGVAGGIAMYEWVRRNHITPTG